MKKKIIICVIALLALFFALGLICALVVKKSVTHTIQLNNIEALADGEIVAGTCCPQDVAICIIGPHAKDGYYYLPEGPCPNNDNE